MRPRRRHENGYAEGKKKVFWPRVESRFFVLLSCSVVWLVGGWFALLRFPLPKLAEVEKICTTELSNRSFKRQIG